MSQVKRIGDLEIDQDLDFQHREWRLQQLMWVVVVVLLVLALAGLFGGGPLGRTTVTASDGSLAVDLHRFVRHDGRASLTFEVDGARTSGGHIELWLSQDFLANVQIEHVSPPPQSARDDNGRLIYTFEMATGSDTLNATFSYRPQHIGRLSGEAGSGDISVSLDQVSYP